LFFVCLAVFILVIGFLIYAGSASRRRLVQAESSAEHPHPLARVGSPPPEPTLGRTVIIAVAVTVFILFAFLVVSVWTGRRLTSIADPNALTIEVIGHQWWWEVRYDNPAPSQILAT